MVGHHKFYGNMTVAITVPLRPKMKSSGTPTATPLRKRSESGAGNHTLWSQQCGVTDVGDVSCHTNETLAFSPQMILDNAFYM